MPRESMVVVMVIGVGWCGWGCGGMVRVCWVRDDCLRVLISSRRARPVESQRMRAWRMAVSGWVWMMVSRMISVIVSVVWVFWVVWGYILREQPCGIRAVRVRMSVSGMCFMAEGLLSEFFFYKGQESPKFQLPGGRSVGKMWHLQAGR